jgi:hypothetical protein
MGISLDSWRAAIGNFRQKFDWKTHWMTPNQSFFKYASYLKTRKKWARDNRKCMESQKKRMSVNLSLGLVTMSWVIQCMILMSNDIHPNPGPTHCQFGDLTLCHSNIRSLDQKCPQTGDRLKLNDIKCHLTEYDVITLSETWLTPDIDSENFMIPGYQRPFRRDRIVGPPGYGGVLAWVSDQIACKRREDLERDDMEAMWMEMRSFNKKIFVCTLYRTSSNSDINYWDKLQDMLEPIFELNAPFFIIGDFNADPSTAEGKKFENFANANALVALISEPTRITDTSSTMLDQILTNMPSIVDKVIVEPPVSSNDHCNIGATIKFSKQKQTCYKRLMWDFKNANFNVFRDELSMLDLESFIMPEQDINVATELWTDTFLDIAKRTIPNKVVTVRTNDKPWYTNALRNKRKQMMKAYNRAKLLNDTYSLEIYKKCRNEYFIDIRNAKKQYDESKLKSLSKCEKSQKQWWKLLKQVTNHGKPNCSIPPLDFNDSIITDDKEKADVFNSYFESVSNVDDSEATLPENGIQSDNTLPMIVVTESEVLDHLNDLDTTKAYGPDEISPRLLKEARNHISKSLCFLYNLSLTQGRVPKLWKRSNIIPIFKGDNPALVNNYRPISLLSSVSKIFERVVFKHMYNHLRDNESISKFQSGFLPGHSTVTQLLETYHRFCKAIDSGKEVRVVFLDISKAFDQVWRKGLLYKLQLAGVDGQMLTWFTDYLHDRLQRVVIHGQHSQWVTSNAGVPQGSVLGPLLFLMFINDITE